MPDDVPPEVIQRAKNLYVERPAMADPPSFVIDAADERGIPTEAHCDRCLASWVRPVDDLFADDLTDWARKHVRSLCRL